jgi:hypothetical protein
MKKRIETSLQIFLVVANILLLSWHFYLKHNPLLHYRIYSYFQEKETPSRQEKILSAYYEDNYLNCTFHHDVYKNSQDCKKGGGVWCKYSKHCYCNIGLAG